MNLLRARKLLSMLLAGAWLPVTVTCRPLGLDGVVRVVSDGWLPDEVVIERDYDGYYYDDCCGYYDDWGDRVFHFDFDYEHDD